MFGVLWLIINSPLVFDYDIITAAIRPAGEVVGTLLWKQVFERFEAGMPRPWRLV